MDVFWGFLLGIVGSVIVWYILTKLIVPSVQFNDSIERSEKRDTDGKGDYVYRIKIRNAGRVKAIDLTIVARLTLPGFIDQRRRRAIVNVPLDTDRVPVIEPSKEKMFRLQLDKSSDLSSPEYADLRGQPLHQIMAEVPGSYVQVYVFAYHGFSGSREVYTSPKYEVTADRFGDFPKTRLFDAMVEDA